MAAFRLLPGRDGRRLPALETFPAIYRPALGGPERYRGFSPALGAGSHGFRLGETAPAAIALAFALASLAPLGLVLKVLVVEEVLLSRCENKFRAAVGAFQNAVLKLRHSNCAPYST